MGRVVLRAAQAEHERVIVKGSLRRRWLVHHLRLRGLVQRMSLRLGLGLLLRLRLGFRLESRVQSS